MTQKKKILLFTLLGMVLIISCWSYYLWDRNKKTQAVIAWVEEQGGTVEISHPGWIGKWPKFTQGILKGIMDRFVPGNELISCEFWSAQISTDNKKVRETHLTLQI